MQLTSSGLAHGGRGYWKMCVLLSREALIISPRWVAPSHVPVTTEFDYVYLVLLGQSQSFPQDKTSETLQKMKKM